MKRFCSLLLCLMLLLPAMALADRTPKPIDTIPYDNLPEVVPGQHHYLLLCVDQWSKKPNNLGNTDGIVLVTFDTLAKRIMLTSVIREALVERPDGVIGRITYIAKNYGPEALCRVLSVHLGVRIEKYILFNFSQIQTIIDYLGGVDITINNEEAAYLKRYAINPNATTPRINRGGTYHFNGHAAVIFMRIRKAGGGGDFMRTQRVRTVMSTLADNCREITYEDARALVDEILDQSTLTNMSLSDTVEAMEQAFSLRGCVMEELRIPPDGAAHGITYAGMQTQEIDWDTCREAMANFLQNSFLVLDGNEEDEFGDFNYFDE
ncbi:MAG: LCP family protein [Clostridia bacterium]|nr:LCP family protein [Clostridia bacterium]MBR4457394.1 LCP family protein [Clostridia bacterium]